MSKVNRSWMAVVAAALLLGTLAGVVWARPNDNPTTQTRKTRKVYVAAADFIPKSNDFEYSNLGKTVSCDSENCFFLAPVVFPCLNAVTVERIRLRAQSGSGDWTPAVVLYRAAPSGNEVYLGEVECPNTETQAPQTCTSPDINQVVWPSQRAYIWLWVPSSHLVWGVTVEYHPNT